MGGKHTPSGTGRRRKGECWGQGRGHCQEVWPEHQAPLVPLSFFFLRPFCSLLPTRAGAPARHTRLGRLDLADALWGGVVGRRRPPGWEPRRRGPQPGGVSRRGCRCSPRCPAVSARCAGPPRARRATWRPPSPPPRSGGGGGRPATAVGRPSTSPPAVGPPATVRARWLPTVPSDARRHRCGRRL